MGGASWRDLWGPCSDVSLSSAGFARLEQLILTHSAMGSIGYKLGLNPKPRWFVGRHGKCAASGPCPCPGHWLLKRCFVLHLLREGEPAGD